MKFVGDPLARYLVEWYGPGLRGRPITDVASMLARSLAAVAGGERPELLYAIEVPQDAYVFGVFRAASADDVTRACQDAGLPADRVSAALEAP